MRHSAVVISTMPDLFVSVKAAKGGDWPGSKVLVGELAAVEPEAMISKSGEREGNGGGGRGGNSEVSRPHAIIRVGVYVVRGHWASPWKRGSGHCVYFEDSCQYFYRGLCPFVASTDITARDGLTALKLKRGRRSAGSCQGHPRHDCPRPISTSAPGKSMSSSLHRPRRITAKVRMCCRVVFTPNTCYGDVSSLGPVEEKDDRVRGERFRLDDPITDRCSHDHRRYSRVTDQNKAIRKPQCGLSQIRS